MNQILKGAFTSTSTTVPQVVYIPSQIDSFECINESRIGQAEAVRFFWRRSGGVANLPAQVGVEGFSQTTAGVMAAVTAGNGLTYVNTSTAVPGPNVAVTAVSNAQQPVVSTATTPPIGSIVRLVGSGQTNLNGLDFTIGAINPGFTYTMSATLPNVPGAIGGACNYKFIAPNLTAYQMFYPAQRNIASISSATSAVVTTFVDHGYAVGEQVRIQVPALFGMLQIDGLTANITAVGSANQFTIDIDTTGFSAFAFPDVALAPFVYAQVVPIGNKPIYLNGSFADAIKNGSYTAMILAPGNGFPGGNAGTIISWTAITADNL